MGRLMRTREVMTELSLSRASVDTLARQGVLPKHYLPVTSRNVKRRPVRFDSDDVTRVKRQAAAGEMKGPDADGRSASSASPPRRQRPRAGQAYQYV